MEQTLYIPVLLGTARAGRKSEFAARFVHAELSKRESVTAELVDIAQMLRDRTLPPWDAGGADERATPWKERMERADALVIVSPEYNRGYPGELKLLLDSIYAEYARKPVLLCGVSSGAWGGRHLTEHLRSVAAELQMVTLRNNIYFPNVGELFDAHGAVRDAQFAARLEKPFEELLWYARALKDARKRVQ